MHPKGLTQVLGDLRINLCRLFSGRNAARSSASHILFVDASADDVQIAREQLVQSGLDIRAIRVETAEALRVALAGEARIDLLVAELVVPGFSWQEVLAMAFALRPNLRCVLYSRHPDAIQRHGALCTDGRACVAKGDPGAFTAVVNAALTGDE